VLIATKTIPDKARTRCTFLSSRFKRTFTNPLGEFQLFNERIFSFNLWVWKMSWNGRYYQNPFFIAKIFKTLLSNIHHPRNISNLAQKRTI